jgi:hypothetical protein
MVRIKQVRWRICVALLAAASGYFWLSTRSEAQRQEPAESARSADSLPRPAMATYDLMDLMNEPLYEQLHDLMQQSPSEHRWKAVEQNGLRFAEIANLIAIRKMATEDPSKWAQFSQDLWQAGNDLSQAARQHNAQAMNGSYSALIKSCNNCHHQLAPGYSPTIKP